MGRKAISKQTKELVIKNNGGAFCCKCGRRDALHYHHIKAVQFGGEDTPDNLALLCLGCHAEWHSVNDVSHLAFDEWRQFPPVHHLIIVLQNFHQLGDHTLTAGEFVEVIRVAAKAMFEMRKNTEGKSKE
jgi:hypothetical protein